MGFTSTIILSIKTHKVKKIHDKVFENQFIFFVIDTLKNLMEF